MEGLKFIALCGVCSLLCAPVQGAGWNEGRSEVLSGGRHEMKGSTPTQTREWDLTDATAARYECIGFATCTFDAKDHIDYSDDEDGGLGDEKVYSGPEVKAHGLAILLGRTFFLKPTPLVGKLKFGIDASWVNLRWATKKEGNDLIGRTFPTEYNFDYWVWQTENPNSNYEEYVADQLAKDPYYLGGGEGEAEDRIHVVQYGLQVGPSVTYQPVTDVNISVYCRYSPTAKGILSEDVKRLGFTNFVHWGFQATWKYIGLYFEGFSGRGRHIHDFDRDSEYRGEWHEKGLSVGVAFRPRFLAK